MAGMIGIDNCSKVIVNTDLFGYGSYCVWSSTSQLAIWLGSNAVVEIGDVVVLRSDLIQYVLFLLPSLPAHRPILFS